MERGVEKKRPDFSPHQTERRTPGPQVPTPICPLLCPGHSGSAAAPPPTRPPRACCGTWQPEAHPAPKAREVHPELRARRDLRVEPRAESGRRLEGNAFGGERDRPPGPSAPARAPGLGCGGAHTLTCRPGLSPAADAAGRTSPSGGGG